MDSCMWPAHASENLPTYSCTHPEEKPKTLCIQRHLNNQNYNTNTFLLRVALQRMPGTASYLIRIWELRWKWSLEVSTHIIITWCIKDCVICSRNLGVARTVWNAFWIHSQRLFCVVSLSIDQGQCRNCMNSGMGSSWPLCCAFKSRPLNSEDFPAFVVVKV
jgi:hypothetical protein